MPEPTELPLLSQVSDSLFLPLLCRVLESHSAHPLIRDPKAEAIYERLKPFFETGARPMYRQLARGSLPRLMVVTVALRTRYFDRCVGRFRTLHPEGLIVNLGCGLDTRFERLDDGALRWVDLDYPEVIGLRRSFFESSAHYRMLPASVLDSDWIDEIDPSQPVLFLAEGLLMYLQETEVRSLLLRLAQRFAGSELVAEVSHRSIAEKLRTSRYLRWKFEHQLHLGPEALFRFGIADSHEFELWSPRLQFLDEWTYYDDKELKLWPLNWMGNVPALRYLQWVVHYKIVNS
ncbi:MAG TPA: class I SAM-dependent methyltransferase [Candidatus Obscuribacterales bacterium]